MKVLCPLKRLSSGQLLLFNKLKFKRYLTKPRFAPICVKAAYSLASRVFSNSNAHGYPQE
ncbi:hypothetical protein DBY73_012305 [Enterobacter sp. RIT418]|nr:hypothetical protein DBY73_012305 [Enterobacter sp. RIT 418]